jgi:hypothetical protein
MRHPVRTVRRLLWVTCAFVLLLPGVAGATPFLAVDLDGDDRRDRVTGDGRDPVVIGIWLSASNTIQLVRTDAPLQKVIAPDLDGNHRLDPTALMPSVPATGSALETFHTQAPRTARACRSFPTIDPFAPRSPPSHPSL